MPECLCHHACSDESPPRPYVAVASMEGMLVNQHLGETMKFLIYGQDGDDFKFIEERPAPVPGGGIGRWQAMTRLFHDCRAIMAADMGESPRAIFEKAGITPVTMSGFIEAGLKAIYTGKDLSVFKRRAKKSCGSACVGTGTGCG